MKERITALFANAAGEIFDAPGFSGAGAVGKKISRLKPDDLIKLPDGADLMFLPGRTALGFKDGKPARLKGRPVAAILPQGYTRTHLPAYERGDGAEILPLYGYAAAVLFREEIFVAALYTDENFKWNPLNYNTPDLRKKIRRVKKDLPGNRIVEHVANCSLEWHCLTAQNLFYRRWECGVPTSPTCNANCLGCISLQPAECCPSPQSRITFKPTAEEVAEVGIYHLSSAPEGIISFGQGCEGEPALQAETISDAIKKIRAETSAGQININTNAGFVAGIEKIVAAGLDSMRVSIISARPESYAKYYRAAYDLADVKKSVRLALDAGVYVSLNMLFMPGFNDRRDEVDAWKDFFAELPVQMVQVRNLNLDPDVFFDAMPDFDGEVLGTKNFLAELRQNFPALKIGNFSRFVKDK